MAMQQPVPDEFKYFTLTGGFYNDFKNNFVKNWQIYQVIF